MIGVMRRTVLSGGEIGLHTQYKHEEDNMSEIGLHTQYKHEGDNMSEIGHHILYKHE